MDLTTIVIHVIFSYLEALITKVGKKSCHEPLYMISNVAPTTPAAGHILSGIARATEALLTAVAIGMGIACVLRFF